MYPFDKISPYQLDIALRYVISIIILIYFGAYLPFFPNIFGSNYMDIGLVYVKFANKNYESWKDGVERICNQKDATDNIDCNQAYLFYLLGVSLVFVVVKAAIVNLINCIYIAVQPHPELNPREYIKINRKCRKITLFCVIISCLAWLIYLITIKCSKTDLGFKANMYISSILLVLQGLIIMLFDRDVAIVGAVIDMDRLKWDKPELPSTNWSDEEYDYTIPTPQQLLKV